HALVVAEVELVERGGDGRAGVRAAIYRRWSALVGLGIERALARVVGRTHIAGDLRARHAADEQRDQDDAANGHRPARPPAPGRAPRAPMSRPGTPDLRPARAARDRAAASARTRPRDA